jgi:hypothetical protein
MALAAERAGRQQGADRRHQSGVGHQPDRPWLAPAAWLVASAMPIERRPRRAGHMLYAVGAVGGGGRSRRRGRRRAASSTTPRWPPGRRRAKRSARPPAPRVPATPAPGLRPATAARSRSACAWPTCAGASRAPPVVASVMGGARRRTSDRRQPRTESTSPVMRLRSTK